MPRHDYYCGSCNDYSEIETHAGASPPKFAFCEHCGDAAQHVLRPSHVIFKGPGFSKRNAEGKTIGTAHRHLDD